MILQVVNSTHRRGSPMFGADLHEALAARGLAVRTVALAPGVTGEALDLPVLGAAPLSVPTLRALRRHLRGATVVVAHGAATLPACALAGLRTGVPFVYRNLGDPLYWANTPARRLRVRAFLSRAAAVVALWSGAAHALTRGLGVPPAKVRIIPNAAPAGRCAPADPARRLAARRRLGLREELTTVAYVGALSAEKNVAAAVRAVARLPGVQLVVAGDGPLRGDLEALGARLAPDRVRFMGATPGPAPAFAAADAVVLTSHSEGMPGVLIEAGLAGLPAVATAIGGVGEVVEDGVTGRLVAPDDHHGLDEALRGVLADAARYGPAARRRCLERFEIGVVAPAWERLLTELSEGKTPLT